LFGATNDQKDEQETSIIAGAVKVQPGVVLSEVQEVQEFLADLPNKKGIEPCAKLLRLRPSVGGLLYCRPQERSRHQYSTS
jgi:hypothetical protein